MCLVIARLPQPFSVIQAKKPDGWSRIGGSSAFASISSGLAPRAKASRR
jgi:hypothetical protein